MIHKTQNEKQQQAYWCKKSGLWISAGCILILVIICTLSIIVLRPALNSLVGDVSITDIVLTTGLTPQLQPIDAKTKFSPQLERIYCLITLSAPKPVNVGIRWFYEGELIFQDSAVVEDRRAFYIQPIQGNVFKEGRYKVEVYLVNEALRTIEFTVGY